MQGRKSTAVIIVIILLTTATPAFMTDGGVLNNPTQQLLAASNVARHEQRLQGEPTSFRQRVARLRRIEDGVVIVVTRSQSLTRRLVGLGLCFAAAAAGIAYVYARNAIICGHN